MHRETRKNNSASIIKILSPFLRDIKISHDAAEDLPKCGTERRGERNIRGVHEGISESNRDINAPRSLCSRTRAGFHFLRAKNHRKRATGDTNSPHLSFKLDFSPAISVARALGLHSEPRAPGFDRAG